MQMATGRQPDELWLRRAIKRRPPGQLVASRSSAPTLQRSRTTCTTPISRPPAAGGEVNGNVSVYDTSATRLSGPLPAAVPVAAWV